MKAYLKSTMSVDLTRVEMDVRGGNWGHVEFEGDSLAFKTPSNLTALEIPLSDIAQVRSRPRCLSAAVWATRRPD